MGDTEERIRMNPIKRARYEVGLTQEQAAEGIGAHQVHISNLERGDKRPGAKMTSQIIQFYEKKGVELNVEEIDRYYNQLEESGDGDG